MNNIYADGIANVRLIDGVVRMDLVTTLSSAQEDTKLNSVGSLMLSVPALVRVQGQLTEVLNRLVEDGVLKKNEPSTTSE
jgi:hypothetical protein